MNRENKKSITNQNQASEIVKALLNKVTKRIGKVVQEVSINIQNGCCFNPIY